MPAYLELEVSLRDIHPRIWRRFLMRPDATFLDLHDAIQKALGWGNYHLFAFWTGPRRSRMVLAADTRVENEYDEPAAEDVPLSSHFRRAGTKCTYLYDFGDSWEHEVKLRRRVTTDDAFERRLLAGERAGPPEDCGGFCGYYRCCETVATGKDPYGEGREFLEWVGRWRPDDFDLEKAKAAFDRSGKRSRRKA